MERELKEQILLATIRVFNEKGIKFTMDDIAHELSKSKKTLYKVFRNKDELFCEMVDYYFDKIKTAERRIMEDASLDTVTKLRRILGVLPEGYRDMDFRRLFLLRDRYPKVYERLQRRLETGWENTSYLIRRGIEEGVFRTINIALFKMVYEAAVEQFFQKDILIEQNIDYQSALREIVEILVDGIIIERGEKDGEDLLK